MRAFLELRQEAAVGKRWGWRSIAEGFPVQNVRFVLMLTVLPTAALLMVLWWWARPDTHPLLAALLAAILAFSVTHVWHRRRFRINESFHVQLLRHLPTRLR